MNKFIKLGKRILALFIVVLLNVNTYAAVGANDGSAFVTKAEFDALVNTFNEQMDSYQSGLNTKVDGAIANYLAGLSNEQRIPQTNLYKLCCDNLRNSDGSKKYAFAKANFVSLETKLSERSVGNGEFLYCQTGTKYANVWFGNANTGDSKGYFYFLDDNGGLMKHCSIEISMNMGGSYYGNRGGNINGTKMNPNNINAYGSYSKEIATGNGSVLCITGYSMQVNDETELNDNIIYPAIDDTEGYFIFKSNENKLRRIGTAGNSNSAVRGISLLTTRSGNMGGSGDFSIDVFDPAYTKRKAYEIIGNGGASAVLKAQVMNYEGCPVVKCDQDGDIHITLMWATEVTTQNYVQTGLRVGRSGFDNDGVSIIDPTLKTNLQNNVVEANKSVEVIIYGLKKDDLVWIKGIPVTADAATLEIDDVSLVAAD